MTRPVAAHGAEMPRISTPLLALFTVYADRHLRRHFHSVRLAETSSLLPPLGGEAATGGPGAGEPLLVYLNHASWWDPLAGLLLGRRLFPERRHYAPIDAPALARYPFFAKLGAFGVDRETRAGARRFLDVSGRILATSGAALWLTPQGRFVDPRLRPLRLAPGLAHLVRRLECGVVVPMAIEYPFWCERLPEVLARTGEPLRVETLRGLSIPELQQVLSGRLEETADALALDASEQDEGAFLTLLGGRAGVGGVYDHWRRLRAGVRGEAYEPQHRAVTRISPQRVLASGARQRRVSAVSDPMEAARS